jgi:hypothetical protein
MNFDWSYFIKTIANSVSMSGVFVIFALLFFKFSKKDKVKEEKQIELINTLLIFAFSIIFVYVLIHYGFSCYPYCGE